MLKSPVCSGRIAPNKLQAAYESAHACAVLDSRAGRITSRTPGTPQHACRIPPSLSRSPFRSHTCADKQEPYHQRRRHKCKGQDATEHHPAMDGVLEEQNAIFDWLFDYYPLDNGIHAGGKRHSGGVPERITARSTDVWTLVRAVRQQV